MLASARSLGAVAGEAVLVDGSRRHGAPAEGARALLERGEELERIGRAIAACGRVVVVEGEAGIGKSALLGAATDLAVDAGARVFSARGGLLERDFGHGVARQLFERPLRAANASQRRRWLAGAAGLAAAAGVSKYHFLRCFAAEYGETPMQYVTRRRIERAAHARHRERGRAARVVALGGRARALRAHARALDAQTGLTRAQRDRLDRKRREHDERGFVHALSSVAAT